MIRQIITEDRRELLNCEYSQNGLICPKKSTIFLYGKEISGFYCLDHADYYIDLFKDGDPLEKSA